MLMTAADYRESLRRYSPKVFVNGDAVTSVADDPRLAPGINAIGVTYDFAHVPQHQAIMTARQATSGKIVNRMAHIDETSTDLLYKLEAVRLVCKISGCAQRYLTHDAMNAIFQATGRTDDAHGTDYSQRFLNYMHRVQDEDLTLGVAMTDAKGDRSKRPGLQANRDTYVHIAERRPEGIVIRGTKAIVTGAPYMHEFLVMPCRTHVKDDCRLCRLLRRAGRCSGRDALSRVRRDAQARPPRNFQASMVNRPASSSSMTSLCRMTGYFWPANMRKAASSPPPTQPTIAIPASAPAPASAIS